MESETLTLKKNELKILIGCVYFYILQEGTDLFSNQFFRTHILHITNVVRSNPTHGELYSIHHYVIKFFSDLRQVGGFLRVLRFPPPIKLTATI